MWKLDIRKPKLTPQQTFDEFRTAKLLGKGADERIYKDVDCCDGNVIGVSRDGGSIAADARKAAA